MIVHPRNWETVGQPIDTHEIERTLLEILYGIDCNCLSLSGGIDSSLLLYFMKQVHTDRVRLFTIGSADDHPDVHCARLVAAHFENVEHHVYIPTSDEVEAEQQEGDVPGDAAVRLFYEFVSQYTENIVAGDGIDEFMGGYYAHMNSPTDAVYLDYLRRLRDQQLRPLNRNSGAVQVFLPYIDKRLVLLMAQIPLAEKVDQSNRKMVLCQIAQGKLPAEVIERRKYGFCDALHIKETVRA